KSDTCFKMSSEIRTSSSKSLENAHKRMMSAPIWFIIFVGSTTLPSDLDIFLPSPSITKPCESNSLYGDTPPVATLVISEELNQPLYWSEPSKYKSEGYVK